MKTMVKFNVGSLCIFTTCISIAFALQPVNEKKLIQWGWDAPTPQYLLENIRDMEKMPFDGVRIKLPVDKPGDEWLCKSIFVKDRMNYEMVKGHIETLKRIEFEQFTDNFNRVSISPFAYDWFDDFSVPIHNVQIATRVAKEAGLKGFFFDIEMYGYTKAWTYPYQKHATTKSWDEYCQRVEEWGAAMMKAANEIYPDITIIVPHGYHVILKQMEEDTDLELTEYGLLASFLNGMIREAAPGTTLIDGYESSYTYKREEQYLAAYNMIHNRSRVFCPYKEEFSRTWQAAFGVMLDIHRKFDDKIFINNYWTPRELQNALTYALQTSDKYVWFYNERPRFWPLEKMPVEYIEAIRRAREAGSEFYDVSKRQHTRIFHASDWGEDTTVFDPLWKDYEPVQSLSGTWLFRTDKEAAGYRQQWFKGGDDRQWKPIKVPEFWEAQGYAGYDGIAWYKTRFKIPEEYRGRKLSIAFGAVCEASRIFVNGELAGEHILGSRRGRNKMFTVPLGDKASADGDNLLVVQVINTLSCGGIWKDVMLIVER